jgi:holo-[acyl-carrier protein] synthase
MPRTLPKKAWGVGIDGIEIERVRESVLKYGPLFLNRVYTEEERHHCLGKRNPFPSLAVRFAAKEAVSKAFGVGIGRLLGWTSISIQTDPQGKPQVHLDPQGQALLVEGAKIFVSLSHTRSLAQAVAILVGPRIPDRSFP